MFWARIDIRASVDQNEHIRLSRKHGRNARPIDSWQCSKLDRARGNGCACVSSAHNCVRITVLYKIDSPAD
jgi:hypothetical protein